MLAAFSFATYTTVSHSIRSGDRLVLYTDGLLEAADIHQEEFGCQRLHSLVRETANLPQAEAADHIISSIQQWSARKTTTSLSCCATTHSKFGEEQPRPLYGWR